MINFKNHDGFSIIEIVISIAILGTTLMALFGSQSVSIRSVVQAHQRAIRLYAIKNQITRQSMQPLSQDPVRIIEQQLAKPKTVLHYEVKNSDLESSLAELKNIYIVQARGTWRTLAKEFKELFVTLIFTPLQKKT
jgi:prepilin-type N-terminal cleavage/methylation domain-containing protein